MRKNWKRLASFLLTIALLVTLLPATLVSAAEPEMTGADFDAAGEIFDEVYALAETTEKKIGDNDEALVEAVYAYVQEADGILEDTIVCENGAVKWRTEAGLYCIFTPTMYHKISNMEAPDEDNDAPETQVIYNDNPALKSTTTTNSARDVYVIGPFYGIDSSFGSTYSNVAKTIASKTGGNVYIKSGRSVTVDVIADALQKGAVVMFDSHGGTDSNEGWSASYSYLCLNHNGDYSQQGLMSLGLTYDEYWSDDVALFGGTVYGVTGKILANHMTGNAPNNFVWNGICLGMATDTICKPLRNKGVNTVYGYSQSVTFGGDIQFVTYFWDNMLDGQTVKQGASAMKSICGEWDYSSQICSLCGWSSSNAHTTISTARYNDDAFPYFVSPKDAYPTGSYGTNTTQSVQSDWTLPNKASYPCTISFVVPDGCIEIAPMTVMSGVAFKLPYVEGKPRATDATYSFYGWYVGSYDSVNAPNENYVYDAGESVTTDADYTLRAMYKRTDAAGNVTYTTNVPDGPYNPNDPSTLFSDMAYGTWYYDAVEYAVANGLMNGFNDGTFQPNGTLTRAQMVTVLYNRAGKPDVAITDQFSDVAPNHWFAKAVSWAAANGVVTGYNDGTFLPNNAIKRQEIAAILYRLEGSPAADGSNLTGFPDYSSVQNWAKPALSWAVAEGLINGVATGGVSYLKPANPATRAQFANIMMKYTQS